MAGLAHSLARSAVLGGDWVGVFLFLILLLALKKWLGFLVLFWTLSLMSLKGEDCGCC